LYKKTKTIRTIFYYGEIMHDTYLGCREGVGFVWFLLYILQIDYYCRKVQLK